MSEQDQLKLAIDALDHLNSFVRSNAHRDYALSSPRRYIYLAKSWAVKAIYELKLPQSFTHVQVTLQCRDCAGTGRYVDDYGYKHDHCWKCSSTGWVTLKFIETFVDISRKVVRWHTPIEHYPIYEDTDEERYPYRVTHWQPNQPGKDLAPWEVAQYLNVVHGYFDFRFQQRHNIRLSIRDGEAYNYKLYVGSTDPRACSLCKAPARPIRICMSRHNIAWHDYTCTECDTKMRQEKRSSNDVLALPAFLITHPEIQRWIQFHPEPTLSALVY